MIYLLDTDTLIYMVRGLKMAAPKNERQRCRRLWLQMTPRTFPAFPD
jgi:hypothetical protein